MSSPIGPENLPLIQQISIGEAGIEIVYAEPRDREILERSGVQNTRVKHIPHHLVPGEFADLIDSAVQLLDAAAKAERAAPESYRR